MIAIKSRVQLLWIFKAVIEQISMLLFSFFLWGDRSLHLSVLCMITSRSHCYCSAHLAPLPIPSLCVSSASLSIQASSLPGNTPTWRWTSPKIVTPTSSPTTTPASSWLPSRVSLTQPLAPRHLQHLRLGLSSSWIIWEITVITGPVSFTNYKCVANRYTHTHTRQTR